MNGCGCQTCVKARALWKTQLPDRCQKGHIPFLLSISLIHKIIVVLKVQELLAIIAQFISNSLQGQLSLQTPKQYWARPCLTERLSLVVMTGDDVHFLSHFFFPETSPTRNITHAPVLGFAVREQYRVLHSAQLLV
ncbi:hypothetical protein FOPG_07121 [Fusarium oxysporum f. sp. conglutinans race 2 54008]|uniref:Uncharacterized protein n=1 Tax=Fusarium oxysporum f. sp. conglutinans race 2 54008 TaxID=1089457 RepID=X0I4R9_FUSOX|nr:hypothetical protein FOPG_07121 [Fusarium oxysporum f. sp. conglutinans race 2 54008]EXL78918.1 hypothetical protein FOPG_07121 [Fusarium oxysporum f. sp. conglutinans race 2 54008]EXL78919.1 hypothetical protein FOPG_07121 [Fusarium oxysporum f. sp. conglutinans race 2 54008]EXL78920.1 hypothetical protein FOPG_07121 [Fusarium oxysporum f. sp. conglutinans race 2 54008]